VTAGSTGPALMMVAGEASGDLHGARLLTELKRLRPDLEVFGLGGDELQAAGLDAVAHSAEVAVVGITEVLKELPRIRQVFASLVREAELRRPRVAVLVDFPDFNLRLAKQLSRRGIRVVYYVSPQVWAWRKGRVKTIAKVVDTMLVLFPFEVGFYHRAGVDAVHVGHPLVDEVPALAGAWQRGDAAPPFRVALLPGSRRSEIAALLPTFLRAAGVLSSRLPVEVRLIRAPTIPEETLRAAIADAKLPVPVEIVSSDRFAAIADSHVALCASGTATLEVGLLGTPLVVCYRLGKWTYRLARLLVRLPSFSLVNLVLGEPAAPELLQDAANPERIAAEAFRLLTDEDARERLLGRLAALRSRLGEGGASERAAAEVARVLEEAA
jgi:lipid-A-disaccharide synthase